MTQNSLEQESPETMERLSQLSLMILDETRKAIIGKDELILDMFIALLAEGNILLDGVPGLAKTSIAKTFAAILDMDFKRMQFVPDILPSNVTGTYVFNQKDATFSVRKGPIFTNILLVDEINRASPKTQSSLLEAMEEKQVTIEGSTFSLPYPFMLITTQNPIDVLGTFPLPEAQIDRFLFKLKVDYPSDEEEMAILRMKNQGDEARAAKLLSHGEVVALIRAVKGVYVDEKIMTYIKDLIMASRSHDKLLLGGSPRASIALLKASKALAAISGRDYVIPDDVKRLAPKVLNHRLILKPEYESENLTAEDIVREIVGKVEVPE